MFVKIAAIFLFALFCQFSYGQISDFKRYQENINSAELKLIRGNKTEALDIYFSTLTTFDGNFCKDIYNSLVIAKELNKIDTFFILFDLVKFKNFSNRYLESLTEFKSLHKNSEWNAFLNLNKQKVYVDTLLKKAMDSLHKVDQYFRALKGSYNVYGDTIKKIDHSNIEFLIRLIYTRGLPGEKEIGADDFYGSLGYDIVLHHWSQSRSLNNRIASLTPIIVTQVQEGRIEPNKCAHYLEMQNEGYDAGVFSIARARFGDSTTSYFAPKYSELTKIKVNLNRRLLYLEPLDEYYEKVKYVVTHPDNKYIFDIRLNEYNMADKESFESFLKYQAGTELK